MHKPDVGTIYNDFILDKSDIKEIIPNRIADTHKYNYGKVLVVAGSTSMPGAAALCANAAIKMGAGIVVLISPKIHSAIYPEIIAKEVASNLGVLENKHIKKIQSNIEGTDVIVIGPGLKGSNAIRSIVRKLVLENKDKKWIIDGDGIWAFYASDILNHNITLTPHTGEFKIFNSETDKTPHNLDVQSLATAMNCNILLKGSTTTITDGQTNYYNRFGNPGMATGGSGDVLSGIIAANIAKQNRGVFDVDLLKTIALSSVIHSLSGNYYAEHNDMETLTATEIINNITNVIKESKNY
jgi:NAD(P)H-hydrate epimerase